MNIELTSTLDTIANLLRLSEALVIMTLSKAA